MLAKAIEAGRKAMSRARQPGKKRK
jgi:hypothetical protein